MLRQAVTPRAHWQARLERLGFDYHSMDGSYWQEDAYYSFYAKEIDLLEDASNELHHMCIDLAEEIVKRGNYEQLG